MKEERERGTDVAKGLFFGVLEGGSSVVLGRNEFCVKVGVPSKVPQRKFAGRLG